MKKGTRRCGRANRLKWLRFSEFRPACSFFFKIKKEKEKEQEPEKEGEGRIQTGRAG
jgi:hypothetical protein